MRIYYSLIISIFLFFCPEGYSQTLNKFIKKHTPVAKWKTAPFDHQVFILNNGQFNKSVRGNEKILYAAQLGNIWAYFTSHGIIYSYAEYPKQEDATGEGNDPDESAPDEPEIHYERGYWSGANATSYIKADDELNYYYTYFEGTSTTIKTNVFRKIIYKNLYPGIDVEYFFPKGKEGIKSCIIVHPGADISAVKWNYSGPGKLQLDKDGNVFLNTEMGTFTDHAPISYYRGERENIVSSYKLNGNTESFSIGNHYDNSKTLVIDPWTTDPLFTNTDKAYDLDWDYKGNVYAYGGQPGVGLQFVKIDSTGAIKWMSNVTNFGSYYGDFTTDKVTGTSYIAEGFKSSGGEVLKVNTNGNLLATFTGDINLNEFWRTEYDACNNDIVIAGGGTNGTTQAGILDTNMTTMNEVNVLNASASYHDMALLTIDPNGATCYMGTARSAGNDRASFNNVFTQLSLPLLSPVSYLAPDSLGFVEVSSIVYTGGVNTANGLNGAAASSDWLYLYNGDTLKQFNKSTGALNSIRRIRLNSAFMYGGLDVDLNNNLFAGVADSVYIFNSSFAISSKILLPDTVYDLHVGEKDALYACGKGYVTQLVNPVYTKLLSSVYVNPASCKACNGNATVNVNSNGYAGSYYYLWSNGSTNQTDSNLCVGVYTVTITDSSMCPPRTDTAIVAVGGGVIPTPSITPKPDSVCKGDTILLIASGQGTYKWSTNQTIDSIKVAPARDTIYTLAVTHGICTDSATVALHIFPFPSPVISGLTWECAGITDTLTVSGGNTYLWNNNSSGNTYYTGGIQADSTFRVVAYNILGCPDTATYTVTLRNPPNVSITPPPISCMGSPVLLQAIATGVSPYTYTWLPGGETSDTVTVADSATTYSVNVSNGCMGGSSITLAPDVPNLAACCDNTILLDDDTLITASGGGIKKYQWEPSTGLSCDTCPIITAAPTVTTTYTVTGTDTMGCQTERTVTITVEIPCVNFKVPNVFTPNYQGPYGTNNVFYIKTVYVDSWSLYIYDRWGVEVYRSGDPKEYWTGTTEGNSPAPSGVYYYVINATCQGNVYKKDGFVQLIR